MVTHPWGCAGKTGCYRSKYPNNEKLGLKSYIHFFGGREYHHHVLVLGLFWERDAFTHLMEFGTCPKALLLVGFWIKGIQGLGFGLWPGGSRSLRVVGRNAFEVPQTHLLSLLLTCFLT